MRGIFSSTGGAIIAIVALMVAPGVASITALATIGNSIDGWVRDNSANPIVGATVTLSDGRTTTTGSTGSYTFEMGLSCGTYLVTASKVGYWLEKQNVTMVRDPSGCFGTGNFQLPADAFTATATELAIFSSVNFVQTSVTTSFSVDVNVKERVDALHGTIGGSASVMVSQITTGSELNKPSLVWRKGVFVTGAFWNTDPTRPIDVWVGAQTESYEQSNTMSDYMSQPQSGGRVVSLFPGSTHGETFKDKIDLAVRFELQVQWSVSILGVGVSGNLVSVLVEGSVGIERTMTAQVTNLDSNIHAYRWFMEGDPAGLDGMILHLWQVS
jgi:hypothetical protein